LIVKLDIESALFLIWGIAVGVLKDADGERAPELADNTKAELTEKCLEQIKSLFLDAEKQNEYGLQMGLAVEQRRRRTVKFCQFEQHERPQDCEKVFLGLVFY